MQERVDIQSFEGEEFRFFGAVNNTIGLALQGQGRRAFEVIEDPKDCYRISLDHVKEVPSAGVGLFARSIARVKLLSEACEYNKTWQLVDVKDGHVWLRFGTGYADGYYPCFIFEYTPKST